MSTEEKVTIKCSWCEGQWRMCRDSLNSCDFGTIQHIFDTPIQFINGRNGVNITGNAKIIVTTNEDICPRCALTLAEGGIAEMKIDGIKENPDE